MAQIPAWIPPKPEMLYRLLEEKVVPEFYDRDEQGIPAAWGRPHAGKHGAD